MTEGYLRLFFSRIDIAVFGIGKGKREKTFAHGIFGGVNRGICYVSCLVISLCLDYNL